MSDGRVLAPVARRTASVTERAELGPYVVVSCLDAGGPLPAPGQFYMLAAEARWGGGAGERPYLPRAFSALAARDTAAGTELRFLLEDVGPGTERLCELGPRDGLRLVGPLGQGFRAAREGRRPLLVGGGVGIAPIAIWSEALGAGATTLLGFRDGAHAAGAELVAGAVLATDDGSVGHHGRVTELLAAELAAGRHVEVYACGPPPMLESVRALCAEHGVPGQLALESGMACGFGACFGCVVSTRTGYVRLCLDGPVLEADALDAVPTGHAAAGVTA